MKAPNPLGPPAAVPYLGFAVAGMIIVFLAQSLQGLGNQNGLLLLVGVGTLVVRFFWIPYLYLGALAFFRFEMDRQRLRDVLLITDLLLCAGALLYAASIFRIHGLAQYLGPYDRRLKTAAKQGFASLPENPRSAKSIHPLEFAWLFVMIPVVIVFAQVFTQYAQGGPGNPIMMLVWWLVVGLLVTRLVFDFWRRSQMDSETAQLYLQETLWQATRAEQDHIAVRLAEKRWFRWGSLARFLWTIVKVIVTLLVVQRLLDMRQ